MVSINTELHKARQSLLDLTMRNRLLNYRQSVTRSIRVTGELPAEIYDALVLREKKLEFRGSGPRNREVDVLPLAEAPADFAAELPLENDTWRRRGPDELQASHTDRFLQTSYDDEALSKKLFRIYHEGRSAVEEQGYSIVHLAIGFLEWYESDDSNEVRRAPLVLIPVELERVRAGDFSRVGWTGEDVFSNISLAAKLAEQGVALPSFEPPEIKDGIDDWLQQVVAVVAKKRRWRVVSETSLDFFTFTKFVMYKDLDPATWPDNEKVDDHPLLQSLFNPQGVPASDDGFDEREIDSKLTARDLWHVRDADPSQIAVIEDVKAGRNVVVQGPPGTGKSQTITNLIAEALAANKTVLFVSEKMAALEVVKSRLDEAGLGPFCLELHSRKANKKAVLAELQRALKSQELPPAADTVLDEHESLKKELNLYACELGRPVGKLGLTPFQLYGMKQKALTHFEAANREVPSLPAIPDAATLTDTEVVEAVTALRDLAYAMPIVQPVGSHPWRHSALKRMLPHEESDLRELLAHVRSAAEEVMAGCAEIVALSGAREAVRLADVDRLIEAASVLARAASPTEIAVLLNADWNEPNEAAEILIQRIEDWQTARADWLRTFTAVAVDGDLRSQAGEFAHLAGRLFRIFDRRYRMLRKQLVAAYAKAAPKTAEMVANLADLAKHQERRDELRSDSHGAALFGNRWRAEASDCDGLRDFAKWIVKFREYLISKALTEKAIEIAASRSDNALIASQIDNLRRSVDLLRERLSAFVTRTQLDTNATFGCSAGDLDLKELSARVSSWKEKVSDLFRWAQFNAARAALQSTAAAPIERLIIEDRISDVDVQPVFHAALADSLLRAAFNERAPLGSFVGELHEKKIARFREIDGDLMRLNRARLSRRLHERRPQIGGGASRHSEVGILLGEFNRRRGHMAIRKLLSQAGGLIQRIKPCFLMSPLSIAQFLNPRGTRFDLIVFDEASQVRPEDAVGALLRGEQLVVMGDVQQLPPTSFFDTLGGDRDRDDEDSDEPQVASVTDVESILHQCARSYPTKMLNWHYRSRHESLIAISNSLFYENALHVYPSSIDWADDIGLQFVHLPHTLYDRGKSSMNRLEAQAVAAAAIEHYRHSPGKSLGVGTFNIKQQQAILEEIEVQLRAHPEMELLFKSDKWEHFFVKNLETIQGDERDVILISVGYGRDSAGKLSLNFGPVNRDGGERRLNVLMSRARERCVVFSNFTASELSLDSTASKGLLTLKSFLEFAQTRQLPRDMQSRDDTDSPFEDAVASVLRSHGHEVRVQVGCAGFRVDLAVVDPRERGRYLLGIECDGAKYHSSPVARDRDRLRQQILESLGWTIYRIWSTDWYRNRADTTDRMLAAIENAKNMPRRVIGSPATQPSYASSYTADEYEEEYAVYDYTPTEVAPSVVAGVSEEDQVTLGIAASSLLFNDIPAYEVCRSLRIPVMGELHDVSAASLAFAIEDVVQVEGPVHLAEVIRRIRTLWGLHRAGNRIREAVERGIQLAVDGRIVERDGDFLRIPNTTTPLRRRNGDPPARIDLISDAEIAESVKHVLRMQFATARRDLINAAARRLGIQATSSAVETRVDEVVENGIRDGWWRLQSEKVQLIG